MDNTTQTVLITGGAGFFGSILKQHLLEHGLHCVSIDLLQDPSRHERLVTIQGDICDKTLMERLFQTHRFSCVFHIAAILAHDKLNRHRLWPSNVDATKLLLELCKQYHVPRIVFTSSNCLWAKNFGRMVTEQDPPAPIEIYGRSKQEAENILLHSNQVKCIIIRCPTIIDSGRLGLLTLLFDFIRENRKVWVVGSGLNRYQFIFAPDLADACIRAMAYDKTTVFNIGSDHVEPLCKVYEHLIQKAESRARVAHLPKRITLAIMRLCYYLGISPLGPYHYKMIAEDFIFDTSKIKAELGWMPTLTNAEMLWRAYSYYTDHYLNNTSLPAGNLSAHQQTAKAGIIRLLKWLS